MYLQVEGWQIRGLRWEKNWYSTKREGRENEGKLEKKWGERRERKKGGEEKTEGETIERKERN